MYKGMASELGLTAMPLDPLNDCPRYAYYMDGVFVAADGRPYVRPNMVCVRPNMVCVFERYAGDIGWRHAESPISGKKVINTSQIFTCGTREVLGPFDFDIRIPSFVCENFASTGNDPNGWLDMHLLVCSSADPFITAHEKIHLLK